MNVSLTQARDGVHSLGASGVLVLKTGMLAQAVAPHTFCVRAACCVGGKNCARCYDCVGAWGCYFSCKTDVAQ